MVTSARQNLPEETNCADLGTQHLEFQTEYKHMEVFVVCVLQRVEAGVPLSWSLATLLRVTMVGCEQC